MESREVYQRPNKRLCVDVDGEEEKVYRFKVLLPNGTSTCVTFRDPKSEWPLEEFVHAVKSEYMRSRRVSESSQKPRKAIKWSSENIYLEDAFDEKIRNKICFMNFKPNKCHILRLHDGSGAVADTFENMWDLTPATELLTELSEDYAFETALADLIDNSLQAVWSNDVNERKLISVELERDRISIFDTGPGMDASDEYSLVKWGKMGASIHRSSRGQAIGGQPPYIVPFFGMFGYGGPIASMHLGRRALVSSKRKESKKVYTLHLEREALISSSGSEHTWRTDGGIIIPLKDDVQRSPQGSFTKVEIFGLKMKSLEVFQLRCKLKDIYFPYIQCDEGSSTGRTITPIEFQVNGVNLAEVEGGEVATTNLHSCNGPDFVLQLHFHSLDNAATKSQGSSSRTNIEANACLKCVYFPIVEGKENIERILEKLGSDEFGIAESFEMFGRVSIRRLGRLLPDARWAQLPFMDFKQKKGEKAQTLKRCCLRVKCFIDTDAGFNPTPSKTDLAYHHPFTIALKNFGNKLPEKEKEISVDISRDGKKLTLLQLEKEYQEWIFKMHDRYDEAIDCGRDQPAIVVSPNKKVFGISSDVVRIHRVIKRKEKSWKHGQKIKVLKGACPGVHKKNIYATLEYFLLEGLQGEAGGDARIICRPLDVPDENGCVIKENNGDLSLDIRGSLSLPISVIDSGKCLVMDSVEWGDQLEKQRQKLPSTIDILSSKCCQELEIDGAFPNDMEVHVGHVPPSKIVAVIRPASYSSSSASKNLDQKYIITENLEMSMEVQFSAEGKDHQASRILFSKRVTPSPHKGVHGLYIFPLGCELPDLFKKAGVYTFAFSLSGSSIKTFKKKVLVKVNASSEVRSWRILRDEQSSRYKVSVGACFPPLSIACYDSYENRIPFPCIPEVMVKLLKKGLVLIHLGKMKADLSSNKLTMKVKDVLIESSELDRIQPTYEATLVISSPEELLSVSVPCQVKPGPLQNVIVRPPNFGDCLRPGRVINELVLEMFDAYKNHVCKGCEVLLNVDGLSFQDQIGPKRKVDDLGRVDLSGVLKVTAGYGENVLLSVIYWGNIVFKEEIAMDKRELKIASKLPEFAPAGSQLEGIVFEVVNAKGEVDENFHDELKYGQTHTLALKTVPAGSDDSVRYAFRYGRCIVPAITLPQEEGIFCFVAAHSCHPEINLSVKVQLMKAPKVEHNYIVSHCSDGKSPLLLEDSASKYAENLVESIVNEEKKLLDECHNIGLNIGTCEKALEDLNDEETAIKQYIAQLQDSLEIEQTKHLYNHSEKEVMMELIASKDNSAPSIFCTLSRNSLFKETQIPFLRDIVGLVALLATVRTPQISRILADYLGEDQMLAVVCKSRAAADALEKYEEDGSLDDENSLYALATSLGKSIKGRFVVICLEDIRPYTGGLIDADTQRTLTLPNPTLANGELPLGFLGYAVNLIDIDINHFLIMTAAGYGLRETLFFRLFGELQVYETMEHLKQASGCIRSGAVSLDGGIARGSGVISLGYRKPEITFPVVAMESLALSQDDMETLKLIEKKKEELKEKSSMISKVLTVYEKSKKKFKKRGSKYSKFLEEKGKFLKGYKGYYLEYSPDESNN